MYILSAVSILLALVASVLAAPPLGSPTSPRTSSKTALRGVNVGGWLVLEKWMSSSLFTGKFAGAVDQWTFDSINGSAAALQQHWTTWFTQSDVTMLKQLGFNALRIPIGFWAFDNAQTPYHQGAAAFLDQALIWARQAHMQVLIDLHGCPGSQNGQDHSGHAGPIQWQLGNNLNRTTQILLAMVAKYGQPTYSDVVLGIELVNEPSPNKPNVFSTSQSWAVSTYNQIQTLVRQRHLNPNLQLITHDSFMGPTRFLSVVPELKTTATGKATFGIDQHNYQLFTDQDNAASATTHLANVCAWSTPLAQTRARMPMYVGEWSALTNTCVWANGTSFPGTRCPNQKAARSLDTLSDQKTASPDSSDTSNVDLDLDIRDTRPELASRDSAITTQSCACAAADPAAWTPALIAYVRRYVEAQLDVFEANADGHFLWSLHAPGGWGLGNLVSVGAFPSPITARKYPKQCP